jgi:hypothetical protein
MKLKMFLFICIFSAFAFVSAQAINFESLVSSEDANEICLLEDDLLKQVNDIIAQDPSLSEPITSADIDWNSAYKIYVDSTVFQSNTTSTEEILDLLASQDSYIWQIPIQSGSHTLIADFSKRLAPDADALSLLSEEEQADFLTSVGHWVITAVSIYDSKVSMPGWRIKLEESITTNQLDASDQMGILIGGESGIHSVIGLIANEQDVTHIIPLQNNINIGTTNTYSAITSNLSFEKGIAYSFSENASILSQIEPDSSSGGTGTAIHLKKDTSSSLPPIIYCLTGCGIVGLIVLYLRKKHTNS